jgi:HK97 gp10 family phage protein
MSRDVVRIEGLGEIVAALSELPKTTSRNVVRRILKRRAEPFAETARALVPVDKGFLRESIVVSTKLTKHQRRQHRKEAPEDIEVYIGPNADPAAHLQEFGTSRFKAQPFMRPAWDQNKAGAVEGIAADLWQENEKAIARRARKAAKAAKG